MKGGPWGHDENRTELQRRILEAARLYPDESAASLAERCDCSASYVRETLREHAADDDRGFAIEVDGPIGSSDLGGELVVGDAEGPNAGTEEHEDRSPVDGDDEDRTIDGLLPDAADIERS